MLKERSNSRKVNQEMYGILFNELLEGPCTANDLATVTGLHLVTVQDLLRTLRRHKVVYISGWQKNGRDIECIAIFSFGRGKDKKPKTKTRAEIARNYRLRKEARAAMQEPVRMTAGVAP